MSIQKKRPRQHITTEVIILISSNLNCLEHFLAYWLFARYLLDFFFGRHKFFKPYHFILGIIKTKVRVNIHRYRDIRMPHKVLQSLWVHSCSRHVATVSMPTNMRSDVRHLYLKNVIVSLDCVIESVFPMHGYFRHSILISEKKSGITLNHYLGKVCGSVFNDSSPYSCRANALRKKIPLCISECTREFFCRYRGYQ